MTPPRARVRWLKFFRRDVIAFTLCCALAAACVSGEAETPGGSAAGGGVVDMDGQLPARAGGGAMLAGGAGSGTGGSGGVRVESGGGSGAGAIGGALAGMAGAAGSAGASMAPARNVHLALVEINQGTSVALSTADLTPRAERNAVLIAGRPGLLRAHVTTGPGYAAKQLSALLTLEHDGVNEQRTASLMVSQSSAADDLASTFNFLLTASDVTPDLKLSLELCEALPSPIGADLGVRFPAQGLLELSAESDPMALEVVIVPAKTPGGTPQSTPERRKKVEQRLFDLYPIQELRVTWADPASPSDPTDRTTSYQLLRDLCQRAHAASNVFYHLIVRRADTGFEFRGISAGANTPTVACSAVGITVVENAPGEDVAYVDGTDTPNGGNPLTVAHELAHNHGRKHVLCGDVANPDLAFPYADGFLGSQGYSLSEGTLKPTSQYKELMGYCQPRWVSDWTYGRLAEAVHETTRWRRFSVESGTSRLLSGLVSRSGKAIWSIVPGRVDAEQSEDVAGYAKLQFSDHEELAAFTYIPSSEDGEGDVMLDLPSGALPSVAVLTMWAKRHEIDVKSVPNYAR